MRLLEKKKKRKKNKFDNALCYLKELIHISMHHKELRMEDKKRREVLLGEQNVLLN